MAAISPGSPMLKIFSIVIWLINSSVRWSGFKMLWYKTGQDQIIFFYINLVSNLYVNFLRQVIHKCCLLNICFVCKRENNWDIFLHVTFRRGFCPIVVGVGEGIESLCGVSSWHMSNVNKHSINHPTTLWHTSRRKCRLRKYAITKLLKHFQLF